MLVFTQETSPLKVPGDLNVCSNFQDFSRCGEVGHGSIVSFVFLASFVLEDGCHVSQLELFREDTLF